MSLSSFDHCFSKSTLIVGGGGFLGQALVARLALTSNRKIIVVGRSETPRFSLPSSVLYYSGNINDVEFMGNLFDKVDEIVDLAYGTTPKTSYDDPVYDVIANLPASVTLQRIASERGVLRYLLVSTGGAIYGHPEYLPINELHPTNPISPYGISKLVTEKYAGFFHQMRGLPVIIARPANAYGSAQFGLSPQGFIGVATYALLNGLSLDVFGERGTIRDYIYIDDVVDGLMSLLDKGTPGEVYNIGSGIGSDNIDVLNILGEALGIDYSEFINNLPARSFDVSANVLDCNKIFRKTGWRAKFDLRQGFEKMLVELNAAKHIGLKV